ncbi:hypothetical protein SASPL_129486 [Salvia splendens]|uniref:Phospholipase C n=1 Tax=Salvia splendens TaxID=180675 RepID=A0A8X8ZPH1_SALSN|nr:hypothetical protein SASPL_129486 [Salvia splendens]
MQKSRLMPISVILLLLLLGQPGASSGPIKTVVVLVMENWLNPEINGVDGSQSNPLNTMDPNSKRLSFGDQSHFVDPDPGHSFQAIREQIFGSNATSATVPPMNSFAQQAASIEPDMPPSVMNGFQPDKVAVYKTLASEFALFDRWFASVPASTQPNRLYVHSGTSHGAVSNYTVKLAMGFPQRTIFDDVADAGLSFGIYFQNVPSTLFYRNLRKIKYITKFHTYGQSFKHDATAGNLPAYTGQMFVKEVYEILRSSLQWNQTLLLINYDEHGGFYDHVPMPVKGVPSPDHFNFKFDRLGVRVPTTAVSPWIKKGTVVHGPNGFPTPTSEYKHSSIPATVRKILNLPSPPLTTREQWAGTFEGLFQQLTQPRTDCPLKLPDPLVLLAAVLKGENILTSFLRNIAQNMTVRQGVDYMDEAVKSFLEAGFAAKKMGVDPEQIVKMRPSLSTRP